MLKKILYTLLGISIAIAGSVSAVQVSVPQATAVNKILVGLSTGNWANSDLKTVNGNSLIGSGNITISGGGSGGGTWSTTTSSVSGQLINFPNNTTDVVAIGNTATGTASMYFDPNKGWSKLGTVISGLWNGTVIGVLFGGTGTTTIGSGLLAGNGYSGVKQALIGSGLAFDGTTLSANITTSASSTLLSDNNTFSGNNIFSSGGNIFLDGVGIQNSGNANDWMTFVTNGFYTGKLGMPSFSSGDHTTSFGLSTDGYLFTINGTGTQKGFNFYDGDGSYNLNLDTSLLDSDYKQQFQSKDGIIATTHDTIGVAYGGTGTTTPSGILAGNGSSGIKSAIIGSGLSFDGSTLSSVGSGTPGGSNTQIQYNNNGIFGGSPSLVFNEDGPSLDMDNGNGFSTTSYSNTGIYSYNLGNPYLYFSDKYTEWSFGDSTYGLVGSSISLGDESVISGITMNTGGGMIKVTDGAFTVSTTTATSTLPHLSSTLGKFTGLCIGGDCKNAWPTVAASATTTLLGDNNTWTGTNNFFNLCINGDCKSAWPAGGSSASSTLLSDNNTFTGTTTLPKLDITSVVNFFGSYWTSFTQMAESVATYLMGRSNTWTNSNTFSSTATTTFNGSALVSCVQGVNGTDTSSSTIMTLDYSNTNCHDLRMGTSAYSVTISNCTLYQNCTIALSTPVNVTGGAMTLTNTDICGGAANFPGNTTTGTTTEMMTFRRVRNSTTTCLWLIDDKSITD